MELLTEFNNMNYFKNIVILGGGRSKRFWPFQHKILYSFLGESILYHLIQSYSKYSKNIFVVVNKDIAIEVNKLVKDFYSKNQNIDTNLTVLFQRYDLGQGGAVLSLKGKVRGEALVVNANDVLDEKLVIEIYKSKSKYSAILSAVYRKDYFPGGYLVFDRDGNVREVVEKPGSSNRPSNYIKLVVDYFDDFELLINAIESIKTKRDDVYERAINVFLKKSNRTTFVDYKGVWRTIKYPWHILDVMEYFLNKIRPEKLELPKNNNTAIEGDVMIEKRVKIGKFVKIKGPVYIGRNSIIGDNVLIRNSHIGDNCVIGAHSEVARSYLGNGVYLHRNYVGDSVIGDNVLFGAGAVTANFRFDAGNIIAKHKGKKVETQKQKLGAIVGSNSKVGVGTILLPGVVVGKNSWISPGELVKQEIPDNSFVTKGKIVKNKKVVL